MGPVRQSTNAPSETLTVVAKATETVLEPSGTVESCGFHQGHVENGDVYGKQYETITGWWYTYPPEKI